jgi:hypothetical protein
MITEFRPISLIQSFVKIITKALALRFAPYINGIVSMNQRAFIKKRSIHDNFYQLGTRQDTSIEIEPQPFSSSWILPRLLIL